MGEEIVPRPMPKSHVAFSMTDLGVVFAVQLFSVVLALLEVVLNLLWKIFDVIL